MRTVVIDANVVATANDRADHAGHECVLACVDALRTAKRTGRVAIDAGGIIYGQYRRHASYRGRPGVGDEFFLWLHENQGVPRRCERVHLRRRDGDDEGPFEAFPDDPALDRFDEDDRVFVATARASAHRPPILNATDARWAPFLEALARHGISVEILCPELWPPRAPDPTGT